jgi:hypothetical protein
MIDHNQEKLQKGHSPTDHVAGIQMHAIDMSIIYKGVLVQKYKYVAKT